MGGLLPAQGFAMTVTVHDLRETLWETAGPWLDHISANMRKSDVEEVHASSAIPVSEILPRSVSISTHGWVVTSDKTGNPILVMGAAPTALPRVGAAWLLGTDEIRSEALSVARHTKTYVDAMQEDYDLLWNYVDARNELSMRWLQWAGFRLVSFHPFHGREQRAFHTFARSKYV